MAISLDLLLPFNNEFERIQSGSKGSVLHIPTVWNMTEVRNTYQTKASSNRERVNNKLRGGLRSSQRSFDTRPSKLNCHATGPSNNRRFTVLIMRAKTQESLNHTPGTYRLMLSLFTQPQDFDPIVSIGVRVRLGRNPRADQRRVRPVKLVLTRCRARLLLTFDTADSLNGRWWLRESRSRPHTQGRRECPNVAFF
jgi:hypothetical protein